MKKLLMAVAALFAVVGMASAAQIHWGLSSPARGEDDAILANNGAVYLLYIGNGASASVDSYFDELSKQWVIGGDDIIIEGQDLIRASSATSGSTGFAVGGMYTGNDGDKLVLIVTTANYTGSNPADSGFYGISDPLTVEKNKAEIYPDLDFTTVIKNASIPTDVPEPTTYALVGLAAAALALRKRFLKK